MIRLTRYEEYTKSTGVAFSAGLSAYSALESASSAGLSSFVSFAFPSASESDGYDGQQVLKVEVML